MTKVTTTQAGLGICALFLLSQSQGLSKIYDESKDHGERTAEIRSGVAADRLEAREMAKRSGVAMERLRAGCTPIGTGGMAQPFRDGEPVATANGSPLPDGSFTCNALGWTARVKTIQGVSTMEALAPVAPEDAAKFYEIFSALTAFNPALQPPTVVPQQAPAIQQAPPIPTAPAAPPLPEAPPVLAAPVAPQPQPETNPPTAVRSDV
jgi:hypothetical protein